MFPFDVILFDVGGVLLTNGWDHGERALGLQHFGMDVAEFEARHRRPTTRGSAARPPSRITLTRPYFTSRAAFAQDEFFKYMLTQSKPLPDGALGILEELSASDKCLVGALNNEARETNEYRFKQVWIAPAISRSR